MTFGSSTIASLKFQDLRRREGILARSALALLLLVGAAIFFVWTRSQVMELALKVSEIKKVEDSVSNRHRQLVMERTYLRRVERIEQYARENLGMIYPETKMIKSIEGP